MHKANERSNPSSEIPTQSISCSSVNKTNHSVLATALVKINGSSKSYRVLFDGGSQLSYIRTDVVQELKLSSQETAELSIAGFGEHISQMKRLPIIAVTLSNRSDSSKAVQLKCVAVEKLCSSVLSPDLSPLLAQISIYKELADDASMSSKTIHVVVGADYLNDMLFYQTSVLHDGLCLTESLFGYVVHGRCSSLNLSSLKQSTSCNLIQTLPKSFEALWETEKLGIASEETKFSIGEQRALDIFESSIHTKGARYELALPWKEDFEEVQPCRKSTEKRMLGVIRRLKSDPSLLDSYHSVFVDYAKQDMIESARMTDSNVVRFLPHRPVVRSEKATTKIRPVFDASASDDEGMSLNGMILPGPNLLPDLFHVLVRF